MPNLATRNIFHFIVRLAEQAKGDYLPGKIHSILGDLEEMAEDYLEKWRKDGQNTKNRRANEGRS